MRYVWNPGKAWRNLRKHGVAFDEAATVFDDPLSRTLADPDHSLDEHRFLTFGFSAFQRPLVVAHLIDGDTIRIISARLMTAREQRRHERI